jgi:hypothetical protein
MVGVSARSSLVSTLAPRLRYRVDPGWVVGGASMTLRDVRVLDESEGLLIAQIDRVCAVVWRDEVTASRFARQCACLASVVTKYPGEAGFLCVVEARVKPPPDDLRKASIALLREHEASLRCIAGVIEATGFMAALTRSVLSSMTVLAGRQRAPQGVFASVADAAPWLAGHLGLVPTELVHALTLLRAASPAAPLAMDPRAP